MPRWFRAGGEAQPSALVLALIISLHLTHISMAVGGPCGGWLHGTNGWHCQRLATNYQVYWRSGNGTMQMGLEIEPDSAQGVNTVDWFGIGFSEAGGMPGADIALMTRDASAAAGWTLTDMFATGFYTPAVDAQQDKTLLSVEENSRHKVRALISFPLEPCDTQQDRAILPGIQSYVIFAFGQGMFGYHGTDNRGSANLLFVPAAAIPPPLPPPPEVAAQPAKPIKLKSMTLRMPSITLPNNDTNPYVCMDFKLQGTSSKPYHVIEFSSVINSVAPPGSMQAQYVHHALLYNCSGRPSTFGQEPYACADLSFECLNVLLMGGKNTTATRLPEEAGIRMGVGSTRYVRLQVHYYNPALVEGVVDSSGLKITYTSQLRPNDAGLLTTGMQHFDILPLSAWSTGPVVCPPACTARMQQPVHMIGTALHMHKLGVQMSLRHYTSSSNASNVHPAQWTEAQPLGSRQFYDAWFQIFDVVPPTAATFSPGDALVTTCSYSNPTNETVKFGVRASDEMCYAFTLYWPLQDLTSCLSVPQFDRLGLVMCLGTNDHKALGELLSTLQDPSATDLQRLGAVLHGMSTGILVLSGSSGGDVQDIAAQGPWVQPKPASCS